MPHFRDGTPAAIGDKVKGKPYNTPHEVVGEIIHIIPNSDECNCTVAFAEVLNVENAPYGATGHVVSIDGEQKIIVIRTDYGAIKDFQKIV